ncbi:30S ribosomal protein S20 [candidate division FCPU426 bacterium]|nr:30S ribosomal protein S20 [candidate division FCPU426 bacterium]
MPRIKSSIKDARKSRTQRDINRSHMSTLRTAIRKARSSSTADRAVFIQKAFKVIDKAVQNNLIHKNTGSRYKSRLTRKQTVAA